MRRIRGFKGINNVLPPEDLKYDELVAALNVDISSEGRVKTRRGRTEVYSGTNIHSLGSDEEHTVFVEEGVLKRLNDDDTATTIFSGVSVFGKLDYEYLNGRIYYTDGERNGIVSGGDTHSPLGIPTPAVKPVLVPSPGILPAGRYGVLFTASDADGQESGATTLEYIELTSDGSITVSGMTLLPEGAVAFNIYVTKLNGDIPYFYTTSTGADITIASVELGYACRTRNMGQLPAGQLMAEHAGRMYVARDNLIYYSEPYQYGLCNLRKSYLQFPDRISIVCPSEDGIFVASDKTYMLNGRDPSKFGLRTLADYGAVEGTAVKIPAEVFEDSGGGGEVWMWLSKFGVCAGIGGGSFKNVTAGIYMPETGDLGVAVLMQLDGQNQYISAVRAGGTTRSNFYVSDVATADIRRNGVIIT